MVTRGLTGLHVLPDHRSQWTALYSSSTGLAVPQIQPHQMLYWATWCCSTTSLKWRPWHSLTTGLTGPNGTALVQVSMVPRAQQISLDHMYGSNTGLVESGILQLNRSNLSQKHNFTLGLNGSSSTAGFIRAYCAVPPQMSTA